MHSSHSATLNLQHLHPDLPPQATTATILPTLKQPLLSLGQLCDSGFDVTLTSSNIYLSKKNTVGYPNTTNIGTRNKRTGLWDIPLSPNTTQPAQVKQNNTKIAKNAYTIRSKRNLITFLNAAAFSPAVSTWCAAIDKGYFTTWPALTSALVRKHVPKSLATSKGYLKEERQGIRSTKKSLGTPTSCNIPRYFKHCDLRNA